MEMADIMIDFTIAVTWSRLKVPYNCGRCDRSLAMLATFLCLLTPTRVTKTRRKCLNTDLKKLQKHLHDSCLSLR